MTLSFCLFAIEVSDQGGQSVFTNERVSFRKKNCCLSHLLGFVMPGSGEPARPHLYTNLSGLRMSPPSLPEMPIH